MRTTKMLSSLIKKPVSPEEITDKIILFRDKKVMLDRDLAKLYGVPTGLLNLAVKRNIDRFPLDFMFQLTKEEAEFLVLQFAISNKDRGGRRTLPYVFTEQGVAMLKESESIEPKIYPKVEARKIEGKDCVVIEAHGVNSPYFAYGRAKWEEGEGFEVGAHKTRKKTREKTREKILRLIRENKLITTSEIATKTGITPKGIE